MKTLTEMDTAEQTARDQAQRFERVRNERDTLLRGIDVLNKKMEPVAASLDTLAQIAALAPKIDGHFGLSTHGNRVQAGGYDVPTIIASAAEGAIADLQQLRANLEATQATCRKRLANCEKALQECEV